MKIATAAYPLDWFDDWAAYEAKITHWVKEAAGTGADLLVFPEYGAMELATLDGAEVARDLEKSLHAVSRRMPDVDALHLGLAAEFSVHILGASAPVFDGDTRPVNRATLYAPNGHKGVQDKQIMTMFERDPWDVTGGDALKVFDTELGKIGILICYDSEFPLLGRALSDVDVLLVPSCTEALAGYWRVRIGAMARALENQCVSVMSSIVGPADWSEAVDQNTGMGGIFGPPDTGFPATGVLAEGVLNKPGWTYADVDLKAIAQVRRDGIVRNRTHWQERLEPGKTVTICPMR
ncbi:carbon-nitrogen hydrolase family protein [Phaeobacter gallaeciensis]|uniref:Amidohydrolase n=1 Tax=Phaeobacter gallaeciensis TaxID=60890 RepID=A0AAD0EBA4_9RHOB|nr:carbon-nitrogen hydrolase family protein [Phaeobacter gallaeciensis]AHD07934.1 putative amidohydrolase [Phaeobacter gallaeciensis DSM 26640]ATE91202.1 putative amidohydrolase [Phaeobacter gallaeciensis]ATE95477.1 putative amidohydrolase [Phaeobacter gallaeciensis]ATE99816.1 putative amidohydrolase [Phaeobacter gallaeciensis]ATF04249.1 putative amidohydrolase [Phaeobacter gallaeciensis]